MKTRIHGFTLLELIVITIILGVLLCLGSSNYLKHVERSRRAEAKMILGQIRTAQEMYKLRESKYAGKTNQAKLDLEGVPWGSCSSAKTHYFSYTANTSAADADTFTATASRCTINSKLPDAPAEYNITLDNTGKLTEP